MICKREPEAFSKLREIAMPSLKRTLVILPTEMYSETILSLLEN